MGLLEKHIHFPGIVFEFVLKVPLFPTWKVEHTHTHTESVKNNIVMLWMHSCATLFLCGNQNRTKNTQEKKNAITEIAHLLFHREKNMTWKVSFDLLPFEMRGSTDPLYSMWSYSICHRSWAHSARNVCEVACRSGTSEDPPLSADDSRCQPLYLSIPIYILKVSAMKGRCDWGRTDDGAPGGVQLNWQ